MNKLVVYLLKHASDYYFGKYIKEKMYFSKIVALLEKELQILK